MSPALRCSTCSLAWPRRREFNTCPECGDATWVSTTSEPMPEPEARSRKAHADFERFYAEREAARV